MICVSRFCLLLFAGALVVLTLEAAPAPLTRRPAPTPAGYVGPGRWRMEWGGSTWQVTLGDGYRARQGGTTFEGGWRWDHFSRTLVIREHLAGVGGAYCVYEVRLDGALCGCTTCGVRVRLTRAR